LHSRAVPTWTILLGFCKGTGKGMRHVRLHTLSDLDRVEIRAFLRQARKRAGLKRRRHPTAAEMVTRVKQKSQCLGRFTLAHVCRRNVS
jgi:hypothetical protein